MSKRYPGGIISRSAPVVVGPVDGEGGSAPGIWTLEQASSYVKQGTWPRPIIPKALFTWGNSAEGQLGQNNVNELSSPVQVGSNTNWSKISMSDGVRFSAFVSSDGKLWTCGNNDFGQLGQNNRTITTSSPTQVGALTNWSDVSCGGSGFIIAIKNNNTLWGWGKNTNGEVGDSSSTNRSSPVQIGTLTNWSKISATSTSSFAIKTDGTLWSWGPNTNGILGQNISYGTFVNSPVQVGALTTWLNVSGQYVAFATKTDGTLWSWGTNNDGELGTNNRNIPRSSPVQIGALTTWSYPSAGRNMGAAIKTDGTLWTWGAAGNGQLGQNNLIYRSSPVQVGNLTNWSAVSGGYFFNIATKTDGTLWSWGANGAGQLGQNNLIYRSSPVQVGSATSWINIGAGKLSCGATSSS